MSKALCEGLLEVEKENKQKKPTLLKSSCLLTGIYFLFMKSFELGGFQLKVLWTVSACCLHEMCATHNIFDDDVNWSWK